MTDPLSEDAAERLELMVQRRLQREPLQLITGTAHFWGLGLHTAPGVLIPRPETERLVELALSRLAGRSSPRVLDVGTGSGAIALALKHERPDATVAATDVSAAALSLAGRNAAQLGLELELLQADLLTGAAADRAAAADLVISNPPYLPAADAGAVSPEVRHDPVTALYAGADGLDLYRQLLKQAAELLKPDAWLLIELDPRNVHAAAEAARDWSIVRVEADLAGRERFLQLSQPRRR